MKILFLVFVNIFFFSSVLFANKVEQVPECNFDLLRYEIKVKGLEDQIDIDDLRVRAQIAAASWVRSQEEMKQLLQSVKRVSELDEEDRNLLGLTIIDDLSRIKNRYYLSSCIDREFSLTGDQRSQFPGVTFTRSESDDPVTYMIVQVEGSHLISLQTSRSHFLLNVMSKRIMNYSSKKNEWINVESDSSRWLSYIIQKHNLEW